MEEIRNIVNLLALFGVPSLCACAAYFAKACIKFGKKQDILANAIQKMMRRDLTQDYHKYMSQGYIEDDDLDMWMAAYKAYHELGQNGVMDARRDDLIKLNSICNSVKDRVKACQALYRIGKDMEMRRDELVSLDPAFEKTE